MSELRVRFAPSPTGTLHIGNVRTALFNWLVARHNDGRFILRIEDTDRERSRQEWADQIMELLKWLGLDWDEGPFYQSERVDIHQGAIDRLVESGDAYPCFCSKERLDELRKKAREESRDFLYDQRCLGLSREEVDRRIAEGEAHTIRFRVPNEGTVAFTDLVYGPKEFNNALLGDFVIARSDGAPTFLLTCAVDDHEMGITLVIRGEDHLSNTPKQILIMRALGWEPPEYAHLPLICGPDRAPLSKRHGATAFAHYRESGYLPEALMNFLALLGWALDDSTELFLPDELIQHFSIERVNRSPAVFDAEKLLWMNGHYIRNLPEDRVLVRVRDRLAEQGWATEDREEEWLSGIIHLIIPRAKTLDDFAPQLRFFLTDDLEYDEKAVKKHLEKEGTRSILEAVRETLDGATDYREEALEAPMRALVDRLGVGFGKIAQPLRVALTGSSASPPIFDVLHFLGRDRVFQRIDYAINNLCN